MPIAVGCAACGAQLQVKEEFAGRRGKCPKCQAAILVPSRQRATAGMVGDAVPSPPRSLEPHDSSQATAPRAGVVKVKLVDSSPAATDDRPLPIGELVQPRQRDPQAETRARRSKEILRQMTGRIEPVPTSLGYKAAALLVALVMLLLPLVYLALIAGVAWLTLLHLYFDYWMLASHTSNARVSFWSFLLYLGPAGAGGLVLFFMCKPLVASSARSVAPRSLTRQGEPLLFAFVERLATMVGAPCPTRIDVDCQVNASAGYRRGVWSMVGNDLVLTIGLPLVAGLNLRQFAGVVAHEFGHFTQGWGMRLSYSIRSISYWFTRVVYERDEWDQWLLEASRSGDYRLLPAFYLARGGVWLTRKLLWVLMALGHGVAGILLRQMEFDADLHETRLAGSPTFESTCRRVAVLGMATQGAMADLKTWYREHRLGDDFPRLVVANIAQMPLEVHLLVNLSIDNSKTGWLDTHPADSQRIAAALAEDTPGIFHDERPATELFTDFAALSKTVTFDYYKALLGSSIKINDLHSTDGLLGQQEQEKAATQAMHRYFQGNHFIYRRIPFATGWIEPATNLQTNVSRLRWLRDQIVQLGPSSAEQYVQFAQCDHTLAECATAAALHSARLKIKPETFSRPLGSIAEIKQTQAALETRMAQLSAALEPYEQVLAQRMVAALELAFLPEVAARIDDDEQIGERCREMLAAVVAINHTLPMVLELRRVWSPTMTLLQQVQGNEQNQSLISAIHDRQYRLHRLIGEIRELLDRAKYPFQHGKGKLSIAAYLTAATPVADDLGELVIAGENILDRLPTLLQRLLAHLAQSAEKIEHAAGLWPLLEPVKLGE